MKKILAMGLLVITGLQYLKAQNQNSDYLGTTERFEFYGNYWLNLHHFLQQETLLRSAWDSTLFTKNQLQNLEANERKVIDETLEYYLDNFKARDLRRDEYQTNFKLWVTKQSQSYLKQIPKEFVIHCQYLNKISDFYSKEFWPQHSEAIKRRFDVNKELIRETEANAAERLSDLTRSYWQEEKIRVDICYFAKTNSYSKRNNPYTTVNPTHIVMNALPSSQLIEGNWLELLYHESSHHLIGAESGFVGGTISDVAGFPDEKPPRQLWHAYLFFFSGKVTQGLLAEQGIKNYELYMIRNNVFFNYHESLEKHLIRYISNEITLHDASKEIIKEIRDSK